MLLMLAALSMSVLGAKKVTSCSSDGDCRGKQMCCDGACSKTGCDNSDNGNDGIDDGDDNDSDVDDSDFECVAVDAADEARCTRKTTEATCGRMQGSCEWTQIFVPTLPPNGECTAFEQCTDFDIAVDAVSCSGYGACRDTDIDAVELADCTASNSCAGSSIVGGLVFCEGYRACGSTIDTDSTVECEGYQACYDTSDISAQRVFCDGSSACSGSSASYDISSDLSCSGSSACSGGDHRVEHSVTCDGNLGCQDLTLQSTGTLSCLGFQGCHNSEFSDMNEVELFGECAGCDSHFNGVGTIFALGYKSLNNAIIDSLGTDGVVARLELQVYGHEAGNGAEVRCRAGSECLVDCKGTACEGLDYFCETGAVCGVEPENCGTDETSDAVIDGVTCPTMHNTDSLKSERVQIVSDARGDRGREPVIPVTTATPSKVCNGAEECKGLAITGDVLCNGFASCANAFIAADEHVECGGTNACTNAEIIGAERVDCGGFQACRDAEIDSPGALLDCYGEAACANITAPGAAAVHCYGMESCTTMTLIGATDLLDCAGKGSCSESEVISAGPIRCAGAYSCVDSRMATSSDIECLSGSGCMGAELDASGTLSVSGDHGLWSGTATAPEVLLTASSALWYGAVDSGELGEISLKMYAHMAGNYGAFVCRSGAKCELECRGWGCYGLRYVCEAGAECVVSPAACVDGNDNLLIEGVMCPQWREEELRLTQKVKERQLFGVRAGEPSQNGKSVEVEMLAMILGVALMGSGLLAVCYCSKSEWAYARLL